MADPRPITREELARFLPSQRAIRAFEKLFDLIPSDLESLTKSIEEANIDAGTALATGQHANAQLAKDKELLLRLVEEANIDAGTALALAQWVATRETFSIDYIDFNPDPPHVEQDRRISWSGADDTMNIHHEDGVVQQVGLETYVRFTNQTGALIPNGTVLGVDEPITPPNFIVPYIADGSVSQLNIVGLATQDIPAGEQGRVTTFGFVRGIDTTGTPYGETWAIGDTIYASPTIAGGLTNVAPTAPEWSIPMGVVFFVDATEGSVFVRPAIDQSYYYGLFTRDINLVPSAANTAEAIPFTTAANLNGISIGTPASRIVVDNAGLYSINFSAQITSGSASLKTIWLWFRINGVDVQRSSIKVTVESNSAITEPSRALFFSFEAGDYLEVFWAADSTNVTLEAAPATAFAPASPACVLTVEQIQQ